MKKIVVVFVSIIFLLNTAIAQDKKSYIALSENLLNLIDKYYISEENPLLLNETYPFNAGNVASYTVSQDKIKKKRVAYLWPTSGVFSGIVSLIRSTGNNYYKKILDTRILPGLELYYDNIRKPSCYQSYLKSEGKSDRFYDDNVWLTIDFAEAYLATKDPKYLEKSESVWKFVISGWDKKLGGGIYWCEQKKHSKNTCSNAPSVVAATKLYEATRNITYLKWAKRIYAWTKINLQDTTDYLYYDNKSLTGKVQKAKYAYNSGQMLQGAVLLYKITHENQYIVDAKRIAKSAIPFFTENMERDGKTYRVFKERGAWFVTVMSRGYFELYNLNKNPEYINFFKTNLDYMQRYAKYDNGLFYGDWSGQKSNKFKWLLDQACIIELSANLAAYN